MPSMQEFKTRMKLLREALEEKLPDIAITFALSAKALAERRIKDKGFGEIYSQNKIPAWFFHGKALNAAGVKFLNDRGVDLAGKQGTAKKKRRKKR